MSYIIATGYGRSVNDDQYTVRIISTLSGSDSPKEFSLDTNGFALIYESVDDQLLVPGIVHSRVEIGTIWSADVFGTLDTLISLLTQSEDGEYIIEIERDSTVIWVGSILNEQFEYTEDSAQREVRIVATDALSLLKDIDYSDNGARYTGRQTLDVVIKNIADKWPLHTYLNGKSLGAATRFFWADDVYSTDDAFYKLLPHPAGTTYGQIRRASVGTNCWSSTNDAGQLEFVSCYDVLQSICLTFQWRLYSYEQAWNFVPSNLSAETVNGYIDTWNDSTSSGQLVSEFTFQTTGANNIKQKAAGWTKVFSPQLNRVSIKRDTNNGATVLSGYNLSDLDVVTDGDVIYDGQDTENDSVRYLVRGRVNITNTAVGSGNDLARIVLRLTIQMDTGADAVYYVNDLLSGNENLGQNIWQFLTGQGVGYTETTATEGDWSSASGNMFFHDANNSSSVYYYDPSQESARTIGYGFYIKPPPTVKTGLKVTVDTVVIDTDNNQNASFKNALSVNHLELVVSKFAVADEQLELLQDFDIVASAPTGRTSTHLGTTYIGQLGASMGRIDVQTSVSPSIVTGSTTNWVNQASATERRINTLCVEEVLANHQRWLALEKGTIVLRGTSTSTPKPFNRYKDEDTGTYYTPLTYQLNATDASVDVTLRKTSRNAISITTSDENTTKGPDVNVDTDTTNNPGSLRNPTTGFAAKANLAFETDFSSIIGAGEVKEYYYSINSTGMGSRQDYQGEVPTAGTNIQRRIYRNSDALQDGTDSGWAAIGSGAQPNEGLSLAGTIALIHEYEAKNTGGRATYLITYSEVSTALLLDTYTEATAAYSLRKVRSDYVGGPIVVRRSSDNNTVSVGFTSAGELDTAALLSFCGSGDGFVQRWYDQAGSNDLVQNSTSAQPQIVASGAVVTVNNHPAVDFNGTSHYMDIASVTLNPSSNAVLTFAGVYQFDTVSAASYVAAQWDGSTSNQVFGLLSLATATMRFMARFQNNTLSRVQSAVGGISANTQYIGVGQFKQNHSKAVLNDNDLTDTNVNSTVNHATSTFAIGHRPDSGAGKFNGKLQEFCVWSQATDTHDRNALSDDIDSHYGTY